MITNMTALEAAEAAHKAAAERAVYEATKTRPAAAQSPGLPEIPPAAVDLVDLVAVELGIRGSRTDRRAGLLAEIGTVDRDDLRDFWREDSGGADADQSLARFANELSRVPHQIATADPAASRALVTRWQHYPDLVSMPEIQA